MGTSRKPESLAERFWSLARANEVAGNEPETPDPVSVVNHVLAILDQLDQGHVGDDLSVNTVSFLHMLRVNEMGGDLSYASPEQIQGVEIDERSLVFSIGVLIFERLTGRHPFGAAGNPRRVARISKGEFGSGVNYFPTVPSGLRTVLMKAMGPFPEERWNSLAELREALEYFADRSMPNVRLPGTQDDDKTQVFRPGIGDAALEHAVESGVGTGHEHTHALDRESRRHRGPARGRFAPLLWLALGAAGASAVFLVAGRGESHDERSAATSRELALSDQRADHGPEVARMPVTAAKPASPAPDARAATKPAATRAPESAATRTTAPAPAPAPAPTATAPTTTAPTPTAPTTTATPTAPAPTATPTATAPTTTALDTPPAAFSAARGGDLALAALVGCLPSDRLAERGAVVGLSIRFRADGRIHKLYYASDAHLAPAEVSCINDKLVNRSAGPAKAAQVIGYRLHVSAGERRAVITEKP